MSSYRDNMRLKYRNYGAPWTKDLDYILTCLFKEGKTIEQLMLYFGRNEGGILERLKHLYLIDPRSSCAVPKYDPEMILRKEQELKQDINKITHEIKNYYDKLNIKQRELLEVVQKKTAQNLEYKTLDACLQVAINDMIDNGWYFNEDQAMNSLLNRVD